MRAISEPPRRPETCTRTPVAPERIADVSARFIARRNATRFWSCSAIDWATSFASSSGRLTSRMFTRTCLLVILCSSRRSASTSVPDLPITMPGPRGVDVDGDLVLVLADADVRQAGVAELALDVLADLDVLEQVVGELALVEPVRLPVVDVADPESFGMNLLSH